MTSRYHWTCSWVSDAGREVVSLVLVCVCMSVPAGVGHQCQLIPTVSGSGRAGGMHTAGQAPLRRLTRPLCTPAACAPCCVFLCAAHPCTLHGVATWFDVLFNGSTSQRWLSTAPGLPGTHWFQLRCVLQQPLVVLTPNSRLSGCLRLVAHERQSYDIHLELEAPPIGPGMPAQKVCVGRGHSQASSDEACTDE